VAELTQQQLEDAEYVEGLVTDGEPFSLDLSDDRQYRYLLAAHEQAGHTPENRPGMFEGLAAAREEYAQSPPAGVEVAEDGWESGGAVTDVGLAEGTPAAASNGFVGFLNGAEAVNSWLTVKPTGGTQLLATGEASDYGNGSYVPVIATPEPGQTATSAMTASLVYSYKLKNEPWKAQTVVRKVTFVGEKDPVVDQPKKEPWTPPGNKFIQIAIGRGAYEPDCDYWLAFNPNEVAYYVPFVGHAEFPSALPTPLTYNGNVFIASRLARLTQQKEPKGGSKPLPPAEAKRLVESMQVSGNTLSWSAPAPPKGHPPSEHGNTLNWGVWPGGYNGELVFLYLQITVKLTENPDTFGIINVESSLKEEENPTDGTRLILPLRFVYSCLAQGTPILLANGERKPFELVERGEMVRAGDGGERQVASNRIGRYVGKMVKLAAGETEIVLSRNHVVTKGDGQQCFAGDLRVGDTVGSAEGPVELTVAEEIDFDGFIGNLSLSEPGEPVDPARNSMIAGEPGGITVCDYEVQADWEARQSLGKEAVLENLDPALHQDYLNYLSEQEREAVS
jgi:hypothetical protein